MRLRNSQKSPFFQSRHRQQNSAATNSGQRDDARGIPYQYSEIAQFLPKPEPHTGNWRIYGDSAAYSFSKVYVQPF